MIRPIFLTTAVVLLFALSLAPEAVAKKKAAEAPENLVVQIARSFPDGGVYNKQWKGSGTVEEIRFKDTRILAKSEGGTYCSGFTFTVVMRAAEKLNLLNDKTPDQIKAFQKQWYGATADADTRERQCVVALEQLGIGKAVEPDDAQPGDFCQIWRSTKSGHSVVFLGYVEENGQRIGLKYRSSQGSTNGIGDKIEYFDGVAGKDGKVLRERTYFGRLNEK